MVKLKRIFHNRFQLFPCIFPNYGQKIYIYHVLKEEIMDTQRAKDIINSRSLINVNYHGIPVFIQQVHEGNDTATVFPLSEMENE